MCVNEAWRGKVLALIDGMGLGHRRGGLSQPPVGEGGEQGESRSKEGGDVNGRGDFNGRGGINDRGDINDRGNNNESTGWTEQVHVEVDEDDGEDELMCWECVTDENALKITQDLNNQGMPSTDGLESESGSGLGFGAGLTHNTPQQRGVFTLSAMRRMRAWRVLFTTPTCSGTRYGTLLRCINTIETSY